MRTTDQPEPFHPLGPPIRDESAPQPIPAPVAPGIVRDPDGTLRTIIPPTSAQARALYLQSPNYVSLSKLVSIFAADRQSIEVAGTMPTIIPPLSPSAPALRPMQTRDRMPGDVTYTSNIPRHESPR